MEHTIETIHAGEFVLLIAAFASLISILAVTLAWYLYTRRYQELLKLPRAKRPDDPLQQIIGPVFTVFENKYWVDELYWAVILRPYIWLSRFLAEQVDWRFWHDWFHDTVIARSFRGLARFLAGPFDLGVIDGIANGLASLTVRLASNLRVIQTGFVRNYAHAADPERLVVRMRKHGHQAQRCGHGVSGHGNGRDRTGGPAC